MAILVALSVALFGIVAVFEGSSRWGATWQSHCLGGHDPGAVSWCARQFINVIAGEGTRDTGRNLHGARPKEHQIEMGSNPCHLQERPLQGGTGPQSRRAARIWCTAAKRRQWHSCGSWSMRMLAEGESSGKDCQEGGNRQSLSNVAIAATMLSRHPDGLFPTFLRGDGTNLERCPKNFSSADPWIQTFAWSIDSIAENCLTAHLKRWHLRSAQKKIPKTRRGFSRSSWRPLNWECP